jgi:cell division protein FtsZ
MQEVAEAAKIITNSADENAKVIFGAVIDENMGDEVRLTVIATGFEEKTNRFLSKHDAIDDDNRTLYAPKKSFYSSSTFHKRNDLNETSSISLTNTPVTHNEVDREEDDEPSLVSAPMPFTRRSVPLMTPTAPLASTPKSFVQQTKPSVADDEDLEIPAFLRKKIG